MITILFLAADPTDASRLRLGEEAREIQEKLQLAKLRDNFVLHQRFSVRPADISQSLLDLSPQIVHFSGHGTPEGTLCFENKVGQIHPVRPESLAALFNQFSGHVNCVLLNACYSELQANAIAKHINYVIGMNHAIGDKAAIAFSVGFYQALAAGRSIEEAYELGCVQINMENIPDYLIPVLIKKTSSTGKLNSTNDNAKNQFQLQEPLYCPVCGKTNHLSDTFRCRICLRPHICLSHFDENNLICTECISKFEFLIFRYFQLLVRFSNPATESSIADLEEVVIRNFAQKHEKTKVRSLFVYERYNVGVLYYVHTFNLKKVNLLKITSRKDSKIIIEVNLIWDYVEIRKDVAKAAQRKELEREWTQQYLLSMVDSEWKIEQDY